MKDERGNLVTVVYGTCNPGLGYDGQFDYILQSGQAGWVPRVTDWPHSSLNRRAVGAVSAGIGGRDGYSGMRYRMTDASRKAGYAIRLLTRPTGLAWPAGGRWRGRFPS